MNPKARIFSISSALQMLRKSGFSVDQISSQEIVVLYAISKMSVIDEMQERHKYTSMEQVEFQEFLCRLADTIYNPKCARKTPKALQREKGEDEEP